MKTEWEKLLATVAAVATVLGAIGTWAAVAWPGLPDTDRGDATPPPTLTSSPSGQPSPEPSQHATAEAVVALDIGACLAADGSVANCLSPHTGQVFAMGSDCDEEALRRFAGMTAPDVLRPDLLLAEVQGACVVSLPEERAVTGSLGEVFANPRSEVAAQLRHCLDADLAPVGCDVPHHGEVVGVATPPETCRDVVPVFMGWESPSLPAALDLFARGQPEECLITVKGANQLTQTLRAIGREALPIEPAS